MKPRILLRLVLLAALGCILGCGHLDIETSGSANRILKGAVVGGGTLPAGSEVVVRLVTTSPALAARTRAGDTGLSTRGATATTNATEHLLGEYRQVLAATTSEPVPFQIEYEAEDAMMRHGVNVDVRVSVGGKLRFRTVSAHVVTLASSTFKQEVAVQPVQ